MKILKYIPLLILGILAPSVSYAYVDPGSGSVIVTAILGFVAATGYTCRKYFYKIRRRLFGTQRQDYEHTSDNKGEEK